ncbi:MAG: hypothetical protein AAGA35_00545 [Patescibacteria group bacterium]
MKSVVNEAPQLSDDDWEKLQEATLYRPHYAVILFFREHDNQPQRAGDVPFKSGRCEADATNGFLRSRQLPFRIRIIGRWRKEQGREDRPLAIVRWDHSKGICPDQPGTSALRYT